MRQADRTTEKRGELEFWSDYQWQPRPKEEFTVAEAAKQSIYKLHGSSNWSTTVGDPMLIIGGLKTQAIAGYQIGQKQS